LLDTAEAQLAAGNLETGRELARRALHSEGVVEFDDTWYEAAELISKANTVFMNSGAPCSEKVGYTIKAGDNLTSIANRFGTTVNALKRLNPEMLGGASSRIYPGKTLFALKCDWSIRVTKDQFLLQLFNGDELFKIYHIAVGRENRTPVGTFEIYNKVLQPDWTHPSGEVIPYGDKRNVLGTHWMAIRPTGTTDPTLRGFGIHGTWDPDSIGTAASLGCVRMRNQEVEELYDFIPLPRNGHGTKVTIE
jgi:lipoprotein-anchoring transpeptidase ErfK/SrfK